MTGTKKKKTAKQKRVLVASIVLAGMIVVGGTFAWFQAEDQVTNQLSATNKYNVTVTESDFTPPEQWIPGEEVNKDVMAVNSGNIDAFVRLSLTNAFTVTNYTTGTALPTEGNDVTTPATGTSYVVLSKTATAAVAQNNNSGSEANAVDATADEVTSIQAGGKLVIAKGASVKPSDSQDVNTSTYKPYETGLYIFQREKTVGTTTSYEYTGYYYVKGTEDTNESGGHGTYYAIDIAPTYTSGDATLNSIVETSAGSGIYELKYRTGVTLKTTKTTTVASDNTNIKVDYTKIKASSPKIIVTYTAGTDDTTDDIIININLVSDWTNYWDFNEKTVTNTNSDNKFYLKHTLVAGATSEKLIDSVTLDSSVSEKAYTAFDYDLTVGLESVQVTKKDSTNAENSAITKAVLAEWKDNVTAAAITTDNSVDKIAWTFKTTAGS
jgi:alternate signal-mediated exported protein